MERACIRIFWTLQSHLKEKDWNVRQLLGMLFFFPSEWLCGVVIVIVTSAVIHKVVDDKLVLF